MASLEGFQVLIQQQQMEQEIESKIERNSSVKGRTKTMKLKPKLDPVELEGIDEASASNQEIANNINNNSSNNLVGGPSSKNRFIKRVSFKLIFFFFSFFILLKTCY